MRYYENLCNSLGIVGWQRFYLIEWKTLRAPLRYAFALGLALSPRRFYGYCVIWQSRVYFFTAFVISAVR